MGGHINDLPFPVNRASTERIQWYARPILPQNRANGCTLGRLTRPEVVATFVGHHARIFSYPLLCGLNIRLRHDRLCAACPALVSLTNGERNLNATLTDGVAVFILASLTNRSLV